MFSFPEPLSKKIADENFNWVLTRFIVFELERNSTTLPKTELERVKNLIEFHEKLENYEICRKLLTYKEKMENVQV